MKIYDATGFDSNLTGSFSGSFIGDFTGDGQNVTGVISASYAVSSSHAVTAVSASYAANVPLTASYAVTASHAVRALTSSYALNADGGGFPFSGSSNNPAVITGSMFISGGLVDFTDASVISGSLFSGSFVGDGTGLTGITVDEVTTFTDNYINATTASIVHNLGTKNVFVDVYDENDTIVSPTSITTTNNNLVTVLFPTASTGRVVVAKAGHIVSGSVQLIESTTVTDSFISASSKIVTHNFNTKNVFVQTFFNDDTLFYPEAITTIDQNRVRLDFNEPTTGRVAVAKGGHVISGSYDLVETATISETFTNSQQVEVTHNFSTKDVFVTVYDSNDYVIIPDAIRNINEASVRVNFAAPRSGRIVVAKGGHKVAASLGLNVATASLAINAHSASMVEFDDIANKPNLVSGSLDYSGILNKPDLVSGSGDMADLAIYGLVGLEQEFYAQMAPNKPTT